MIYLDKHNNVFLNQESKNILDQKLSEEFLRNNYINASYIDVSNI
jgi:hypothetical protein